MKVIPVSAFTDNYIWMIVDERNAEVLCVDPGDAAPVLEFLKANSLTLKAILLTHHHDDHIGGVAELHHHFPAIEIYGPEDHRIDHINYYLREGDHLHFNGLSLKVLETPGHTSSHISLFEPDEEWLFCGDTLFSAGCGRVFDGTIEQLHHSLSRLKALPDSTRVYCAHEYTRQNLRFAAHVEPKNAIIEDYALDLQKQKGCSLPSIISLEKEINPFFRTQIPDVIQFAVQKGAESDRSLDVFKQLRTEKNHFS